MRHTILSSCLPAMLFAADDGAGSADAPMPRPGDQVATVDASGKPVTDPATGKPATTTVETVDLFAMLKERCENSVTSGNAMLAAQANEMLILIHAIEANAGGGNGAALAALSDRLDNVEAALKLGAKS